MREGITILSINPRMGRVANPCTKCGDKANEHRSINSKKHAKTGVWFARCMKDGCKCKQYVPTIPNPKLPVDPEQIVYLCVKCKKLYKTIEDTDIHYDLTGHDTFKQKTPQILLNEAYVTIEKIDAIRKKTILVQEDKNFMEVKVDQ